MKQNMGTADRIIRTIIAAGLALLFYMNIIGGTGGVILLIIAALFLTTSLIGFCPLYALIGINSCKRSTKAGS